MKKLSLIFLSLLLALPLFGGPTDYKNRRQLIKENAELLRRIEELEQEVASYRQDRSEKELLEEELSGENENKISAGLENYTTNTDTLLGQWYLHRVSRIPGREQYNMDSVRFTSNVPDSVLMRRLEQMNAFITLPFNETVKNYMILYSEKMPRKMAEMMGLSQYYMPIIEESLRRYDLPLELKYVAVIESAFNPRAVSRVGATGMWQFMYRTAVSYGLRIDSYVDERMDPIKSIDAAARYFRDAYRIFGDWSLAISSYNCGSGNVNKAIKRAGGRRDFWSVYEYLPRETRGYVPAMVGAMYAFRYAKEYGLEPDPLALPTYVDTFHIHQNLHFAQVSELLGIPLDDVRDLNPQYYKDIVPGASGDEVIRLPFNYSSAFLDVQDTIYRHRADILFATKVEDGRETVGGKPVPTSAKASGNTGAWVYYKVKGGDTLSKIARKYNTSVKQIKTWNNLRSDSIAIGQRLKVGKR
ncbi:MAG: transglycosylase SLT domain-containing protein [Bacteroidales bacterium]|nr:transglycosylase SLT domain-containing protein [Bacteroidales bacterium]